LWCGWLVEERTKGESVQRGFFLSHRFLVSTAVNYHQTFHIFLTPRHLRSRTVSGSAGRPETERRSTRVRASTPWRPQSLLPSLLFDSAITGLAETYVARSSRLGQPDMRRKLLRSLSFARHLGFLVLLFFPPRPQPLPDLPLPCAHV